MNATIYKYALWIVACLLGGMTSCSDDDFNHSTVHADGLYFEISTSAEVTDATTRAVSPASEEPERRDFNARQFDNSHLWLLSYTEESIAGSDFTSGGVPCTRALPKPVTTGNFKEQYGSFTLYAAQKRNDVDFSITNENITLLKNNDGSLTAHFGQPWPGNDYAMQFFAFAAPDNAGIHVITGEEGGLAKASIDNITILSGADKQYDLLGAYTSQPEKPADNRVSLSFNHLLAAVKVKFTDDIQLGNITKIELKGVKYKGTYAFINSQWNVSDDKTSTYWTNDMGDIGSESEGQSNRDVTFFLMPQVFYSWNSDDNPTIEISFVGEGTFKASLKSSGQDEKWEMGKTRTYTVSKNKDIFEVSPDTVYYSFAGTGGEWNNWGMLNVKSTKGWAVSGYSVDDGNTWSSAFPDDFLSDVSSAKGNGDQTVYYHVKAQQGLENDEESHDKILRNRTPLGSPESPYDLSSKGGSVKSNTANCYLVNAAGTYSLPLVYGNAIKNGEDNKSAYYTGVTGNNVLGVFKNHLDKDITSPYIYENKDGSTTLQAKEACLVWQDEEGLISDIKLSDDKRSLIFSALAQDVIKVGNAVVAVKDNAGRIMWSWHIWVTDYELGTGDVTVTNKDNMQYRFMAQNIGCCSPATISYEGRKVQIRFTQSETNKQRIVTIIQRPDEILKTPGNQPYFQFGRKDPMPPYIMEENTSSGKDKVVGGNFNESNAANSLGWAIQKPNTYIASGGDWCNSSYMNLWNADNTSYGNSQSPINDIGRKTIYDPSPVGYCVPPSGAFSGFTSELNETTSFDLINSPFKSFEDASSYKGWLFYCKPMQKEILGGRTVWVKDETSGTIHFAGTGYRFHNSKKVEHYNNATWCWSSIPTAATKANLLYAAYYQYNKDYRVNTLFSTEKTYGCIIRPVREP